MARSITPVLLCGGSGTRLWPTSRASFPKQFAPLLDEGSLFQGSAERLSGPGYAAPVVVTGDAFRFLVLEQLLLPVPIDFLDGFWAFLIGRGLAVLEGLKR